MLLRFPYRRPVTETGQHTERLRSLLAAHRSPNVPSHRLVQFRSSACSPRARFLCLSSSRTPLHGIRSLQRDAARIAVRRSARISNSLETLPIFLCSSDRLSFTERTDVFAFQTIPLIATTAAHSP